MRIVLVLLEPPNPMGNAAARWYYALLKTLVSRGHAVTAFATASRPIDIERANELFPAPSYDLRCYPNPVRKTLNSKLRALVRPHSYMIAPELERDLARTLAAGYDVVHVEQTFAGWAALKHRRRSLLNVLFLAGIDVEGDSPASWRERYGNWSMVRAETRLIRAFPHIRSLSLRLTRHIRSISPAAHIHTLPLALDLSLYPIRTDRWNGREPVVSLFGTMSWAPSRSAAERFLTRLWPEIRRRVPSARAEIVGWGARAALARHLGTPGVTIEQDVADIEPYFERSRVLLYAPRAGSGMKIKVLEALAWGVPVVTTSDGVEGLSAEDGVHASIAETDHDLIERTVELLRDERLALRRREAGRALVQRDCDPVRVVEQLETVYASIIGD